MLLLELLFSSVRFVVVGDDDDDDGLSSSSSTSSSSCSISSSNWVVVVEPAWVSWLSNTIESLSLTLCGTAKPFIICEFEGVSDDSTVVKPFRVVSI